MSQETGLLHARTRLNPKVPKTYSGTGTRTVLRHDMGHIVPASRTYVEDYARFLVKHAAGGGDGGGDN